MERMSKLASGRCLQRPVTNVVFGVLLAISMPIGTRLCAQAVQAHHRLPTPFRNQEAIQHKVDDLLKAMTTEEKIGQLSQTFFFGPSASIDERIHGGELGSILFTTDPAQINRMQRIAVNESPHHIPLLFGSDVIHGLRTIFPVPIAMAASWDPSVAESAQRIAASEARAVGINWTLSLIHI